MCSYFMHHGGRSIDVQNFLSREVETRSAFLANKFSLRQFSSHFFLCVTLEKQCETGPLTLSGITTVLLVSMVREEDVGPLCMPNLRRILPRVWDSPGKELAAFLLEITFVFTLV